MSPESRRRTTPWQERDRRIGSRPHCTGQCRRRASTCGACSCSWSWSACWWASCTSSCGTRCSTISCLNALICFVLVAGMLFAFQQVLRLYPEIRWVNAFRIADPGLAISHRPILLAPMATMLRDRTGSLSLSATSMRSIMDSIGSRLDEARDTGRYLVGLLVFLGLLGTFWGLLDTIQSVGKAISALDSPGCRQRQRVRRAEERPRRAAARHGHRLLVLAAGPRRLAGAGLPGAAGEPRARPLLQRAGGMAVGHHRAGAGRLAQLRFRLHRLYEAINDMHRAIADLGQRLGPRHPASQVPGRRRERRPSRSSPRASTSWCARCAPSRRWCASGSTSRPPSSPRSPPCSRTSPPTCAQGASAMAYGRGRRSTTYGEFWPGYVDVLSTLLLVVTFLMSVFMVAQFYVSQEASRQGQGAAPPGRGRSPRSPTC